jgi:hypothetical protein
MTTRISTNNLDNSVTTLISQGSGPKITNIFVTNNSYTNLDDTAVDIAGGYIKIVGTGFATGCQVLINNTAATSVTFISATEVRAQLPATAAGTYVVYLVNSDGGVAIRFNGVTFSGTPAWTTGSTLPSVDIDTAVSIQLEASGDAPMTYALQAGSSLPAGLSLSSSGLLSGTVTGLNNDTTYNFTVAASDAQLQDSPRAFSISISTGDPNWSYVATLLNANTTPFNTDASANSFAVTVNGDTKPNNFGPYTAGYYSNYFDGSGDNTAVATNAVFNLGSNDFSFEAWIYPISITNTSALIASQWGLNGDEGIWSLGITSNNFYFQYDVDGAVPQSTVTISTTGGITFNQWQHVLVTRIASGGNSITRLFINGVLKAYNSVSTYSITSSASPIRLGMQGYTTYRNGEPFHGYISNFRFVNGSIPTAYATAATTVDTVVFTPPTEPLTTSSQGATSAQVELLLAQSNRFIDNSTNNFTVTRNGDTQVSGFDPFVPDTNYSTYGSTYFDGSGDYLSVTGLAFGTGDFTLECWVYAVSAPSDKSIFEGRTSGSGSTGFTLTAFTGTSIRIYSGTSALITASSVNYVNSWCHVAVVRASGTTTLYINGVSAGTTTSLGNLTDTSWLIGAGRYATPPSVDAFFPGYISNFRTVNGTAVYTTNFTPSTAPLTAIANTSLLTLQTNTPANNSVFIDNSTNNFLITRNGNATQGTFSPYGAGWSNYFDGTGDYLRTTGSAMDPNTFTISFYFYPTTSSVIGLFDSAPGVASTFRNYPANTIQDQNNGSVAFTPIANQWNWMSIVGSGGTFTVYLNGSSVGSAAYASIAVSNFTIGTINSGGDGAYTGYISNFRIKNVASVDTAPTTPLQPVAGTSLLTCSDNRFVDDSANNFTITRTGDVSVQRFSPFAGTTLPAPAYSAYFDGTGDYLSGASWSSAGVFGTGDFTVECWVYATGAPQNNQVIWGCNSFPNTTGLYLAYFGSGGNNLGLRAGNTTLIDSSAGWAFNTWLHIAVVRSGTTLTLYINGTSRGSTTFTNNCSDGLQFIGRPSDVANYMMQGYISNFRIVKGTAVYTSTFTPSTAPLTAITNTSLLTCQSATSIDNSTNAFSITANGNSQPSLFSPFTVTYSTKQLYSPAVIGGSMLFDGTGDYLSLASSSAFNMGAANFTVEAWYYFTALPGSGTNDNLYIFGNYNPYLYLWGDGTIILRSAQTSGDIINVAHGFTVNQWYHIAIVKTGTSFVLYRNGSVLGSGTSSAIVSENKSLEIGGQTTFGFTGYMSDFRTVNGTAVYASNFVPPTAPVTARQNTTLLLNGTSAGVLDGSAMANFETVADAKISTAVKKYGSGSIYFDGTGDYLLSPSSPNFDFGTGDFTIEMWINLTSVTSTWQAIISRAYGVAGGWRLYKNDGNNQLRWYSNVTSIVLTTGSTLVNNTWSHIAVVRNSGIISIYIDGVSRGSASNTTSYNPGNYAIEIGQGVVTSAYPMTGYIDDLRITRGVARYTSDFTPPAGSFKGK